MFISRLLINLPSGATTHDASITEAATASATESAVAVFAGEVFGPATADESSSVEAIFAASVSEGATAAETVDGTRTFESGVTEAATAAEEQTAVFVIPAEVTEAATAAETVSATATFAGEVTEGATANATETVIATFAAEITEGATAAETTDGEIGDSYAAVSHDGTTEAQSLTSIVPVSSTVMQFAIAYGDSLMRVREDQRGWGTEVAYDGSFKPGAETSIFIISGDGMDVTAGIKDVKFYDRSYSEAKFIAEQEIP